MYFSILVAFLSLGAILPTEGCSCLSKHLQRSFCRQTNVVLKVKFLGATYKDESTEFYNYTLITYEIDLLQVCKGGSDIQNLKHIYTSTEYYCEFSVPPANYNKEYLVTGPYGGGRLNLIYCDYGVLWSELSEFQLKGIQGAYARGCDCNILDCSFGQCREATSGDCRFTGDYPYHYEDYPDGLTSPTIPAPEKDNTPLEDKMCARNNNGICTWQSVGY